MLLRFWKNLHYVLQRVPAMDNQINALENIVKVQKMDIEQLQKEVKNAHENLLDMHIPVEHVTTDDAKPARKANGYSYQEAMEQLRQKAPKAFAVYEQLGKNNIECYRDEPTHSCAVEGHQGAVAFGKFIKRYLYGNILDIGCGPQAVPLYLKDYPPDRISGLDPLPPHVSHPFEFVQGISEFIPWEDNSFQAVLFATSLDHIFLPELVWSEVSRVLADDGYLLIWTSFDENAPDYDPYSSDFTAYDQYHMFHYRESGLLRELNGRFVQVEKITEGANSFFYAFKKLKVEV